LLNYSCICDAFKFAQKSVAIQDYETCPKGEDQKFIMLHRHEQDMCELLDLELEDKDARAVHREPILKVLPPFTKDFVGREEELTKIYSLILK
jgi:hypothetical protein